MWGSQRCAGLEEGKDDSIQIEVGECWGPVSAGTVTTEPPGLEVHERQCPVEYGKQGAWNRGAGSVPLSTSLH